LINGDFIKGALLMFKLTRNHILWTILVLVSALFMVSPALAQDSSIQLEDIGALLSPRQGNDLLFDIMLYLLFFLGMVNSLLIPDKQLFQTMLNISVVACAIISKLLVGGVLYDTFDGVRNYTIPPCDFPVLIINVWMFVMPMIVAGMLRSVKGKKTQGIPVSIFMGLIGGAHFFLFWALKQQECSAVPQAGDDAIEQGLSLFIAGIFAFTLFEFRARQIVGIFRNRNQK
jgi:hypothetical protein